jgi:hypothetical protein
VLPACGRRRDVAARHVGVSCRQAIVLQPLTSPPQEWPGTCSREKTKGLATAVKTMQKLLELYEMVSLNKAALRGDEKQAILKARLALRMFERAMESFKVESAEAPRAAEASFRMAA